MAGSRGRFVRHHLLNFLSIEHFKCYDAAYFKKVSVCTLEAQVLNETCRLLMQAAGAAVLSIPLRDVVVPTEASAANSLPRLEVSDPAAKRLGCLHESHEAAKRCGDGQLYRVAAGAKWRRCAIFSGKLVSARGWCYSWSA